MASLQVLSRSKVKRRTKARCLPDAALTSQSGASLVPQPRFHRTSSSLCRASKGPWSGRIWTRRVWARSTRPPCSSATEEASSKSPLCVLTPPSNRSAKKKHTHPWEKEEMYFFLLCDFSLQRAYCLTEVHLDFPVWLEDSHSPSTVSHAARLSPRPPYFYQNLWVHSWNGRRSDPGLNVKTLPVSHSGRLWDQLLIFPPCGLLHMRQLEITSFFFFSLR